MVIPEWITKSYIENALQAFYKDPQLIITKCDFAMALGKGENFGGILIRAFVCFESRGETQRNSYIVKSSFEDNEFATEKMKPYDIFNREISIYERVLPKLNALKQEIHIEDELFSKAIFIDHHRSAIIFEDLGLRGFVMADRTQGLDKDHVHLILRKLAIMHATSAVLNEREKGCLEIYDRGFFNQYTDSYSSFFLGNLNACSQLVSQWPQFRHYGEKLQKLKSKYMEIGKHCFKPTSGHVNVLVHGDVWTNNVMFKYDTLSGRPQEVLLIDFQYAFWGSPTLDLHHFFNTSLKEDIRRNHQDELFKYYHGIFTDTLCRLHYHTNPIPSLHRFLIQVEEKRFFAFHSSCIIQPVMINKDVEDADFNALVGEDERAVRFKKKLYENRIVQENLIKLLPMFDRRGLLEVNQCTPI